MSKCQLNAREHHIFRLLVTVASAHCPPVNVVREKLAFTRMLRLRYQFSPTDHACAAEAEVAGFAKIGKASLSTSNSA